MKKLATKVMESPGTAFERGAKKGNAAISSSTKAALSTNTDIIKSCHSGKGLNIGKSN